MPFFFTVTFAPDGLLVKDTGYSDFDTIDAQLENRTAVDNANTDLVFILSYGVVCSNYSMHHCDAFRKCRNLCSEICSLVGYDRLCII
jgi:hypothetical protein